MSDDPILLTLREAAERLSLSARTVWALANEGRIPCVVLRGGKRRLLRFSVQALERWAIEQAGQAGRRTNEGGQADGGQS